MRALIILLINLLFYTRTLWYGYVSDDCTPSGAKEPIPKNHLHYFWIHFMGLRYINSKFAHGITLAIHIINCILIYFLFGANNVSFVAALWFSVNPINTQCSIWISGKLYAMSAMCTMLMMLLPYISPIFYLLALKFFTVSPIISPLLFIPTRLWWLSVLFPLAFFILRKKIFVQQLGKKAGSATPTMKEIKPYKIILFLKTFGYYTLLALWPIRLGHYHEFLYEFGVSAQDNKEGLRLDWHFWVGLFITIVVGLLIIFNWRNPIGFGLWWWVVGISIFCNITTIQMCIAERYAYLPNIGLMYALSYALSKLPYLYYFCSVVLIFGLYALMLWLYTPAYKDEKSLAFRNHLNFPNFYYPYSWIGMFYKDQNRRYEALGWWSDALDRRPLDFKVLFNLSHLLGELGHLKDAYMLLEKTKQSLIPEGFEKNLIDMVENRQKHIREAIEKSEIATQNQIIDMANKIKKGEKVV